MQKMYKMAQNTMLGSNGSEESESDSESEIALPNLDLERPEKNADVAQAIKKMAGLEEEVRCPACERPH